jgi:hypothetical protein
MRRLIRHAQTREFLTSNGNWTNDVCCAQSFQDDKALHEAREAYHLQGGQVYFLFGELPSDESDFVISLADV